MAGCASTGTGTRAASAMASDQAGKYAVAAERALTKDDAAKAVLAAEAAVAASPNEGKYRSLLGQAYLSDGRFASAETSFEDAMTLGHTDARTVIGLAMVKIASGKTENARALLGDHMDILPAADYGLAVALTGDTDEGLRILSTEVRQPDATAKARQNLAYTLALAGRWRESKLISSQDISPAEAGKRVGEWAMLSRPGGKAQQVAHLMGVTPQADSGLPVALALKTAETPAALAAADIPAPAAETASLMEFAPPTETQVLVAQAATPSIVPTPIPASFSAPVASPRKIAAARSSGSSGYVIQLGAFSSAEGVNQAWSKISGHNQNVRTFATLTNKAKVDGRVYHRLALSGFDNRMEAEKLCASLKAKGSTCFVRKIGSDAMTQWVSRDGRQLASRGS